LYSNPLLRISLNPQRGPRKRKLHLHEGRQPGERND
jgi:TATA-binding protein-associated factor Taf7